ncbi:MAG: squalene/phytoene synthase family protein [Elusimicrobia bacterium]|nr:squalene/phytoene synthase family protein [Elusimicrobiota bacterium]
MSPYEAGSNFQPAFLFLAKPQRQALSSVYGYCRAIDDIADDTGISKEKKSLLLDGWAQEIEKIFYSAPSPGLPQELARAAAQYKLEKEHFLTILEGVRRDISKENYKTFEELKEYMYPVASVVGLICLKIFGYKSQRAEEYAKNLGYAFQLTNILRDVFEDINFNRIYLPIEDLEKFSYTQDDLRNLVYSDNFVKLMEFEAQRARSFYKQAREAAQNSEKASLRPAFIMTELYRSLLLKMEKNGFKPGLSKTSLNRFEKSKAVAKAILFY